MEVGGGRRRLWSKSEGVRWGEVELPLDGCRVWGKGRRILVFAHLFAPAPSLQHLLSLSLRSPPLLYPSPTPCALPHRSE